VTRGPASLGGPRPRSRSPLSGLRVVAALLIALFAATWSSAAYAEPADEARNLFAAGVAATRDGRWREARDYFKRSQTLVPKASTLFNLAVVEINLGLGTSALRTLDAFEHAASPGEHGGMLARLPGLRSDAEALARKEREGAVTLSELLDVPGLSGEPAALFEAGREAYWAGRYAQALEYFERAHELNTAPELLYDIGAAADRLRDDEKTLTALTAFLEARPDAPQADTLRARVAVLKQVVDQRAAQKLSSPAATSVTAKPALEHKDTPAPLRADKPSYLGWYLLGGGVAAAGGSVALVFKWRERVSAHGKCGGKEQLCSNEALIQRQERAALAMSLVLGATAAALIPTGLLLALRRNNGPRVQAAVAPDGFMLGLTQRF
jgi:tetratricopeptide (TPR) repeat protein